MKDMLQAKDAKQKPDAQAWMVELEVMRQHLTKSCTTAISESFAGAEDCIAKLPQEARRRAARSFSRSAESAARANKLILERIKEMVGSVLTWLKGVWEGVVRTAEDVRSFIGDLIMSILVGGFRTRSAPMMA